MSMKLLPTSPVRKNWQATLREPRIGILLHYDASRSDRGALSWLTAHPDCAVSYHVLILDDGAAYQIAPLDSRAWHAGPCEPSDPVRMRYRDANSALYGVSIAATDGEVATPAQFGAVVEVCRLLAARHGWDLQQEGWRILGHNTEASPRGRKTDPVGSNPKRPVLSVDAVRAAFGPPPPCGA
jgi:N-acetyl-anhydromuramyl-L-alanine amidase AmpD